MKTALIAAFFVCTLCFTDIEGCGGGGGRSPSSTSKGDAIARKADGYIGFTLWSFASSRRTGSNTNKCNIFVAEVIEQAGASVPHRHWYTWSPIGANEWANPHSSYLTSASCWSRVTSSKNGDVAATGGHVGIVTGSRSTTSATYTNVVKNNWGFRSGQSPTFWRYTCN